MEAADSLTRLDSLQIHFFMGAKHAALCYSCFDGSGGRGWTERSEAKEACQTLFIIPLAFLCRHEGRHYAFVKHPGLQAC